MREMKFRGKHAELGGNWVYGSLVVCDNGDCLIGTCKKYGPEAEYMRNEVYPDSLGQYTGLKDVNDKEIYEGDIVAEHGHYVKSDRVLYQKIQWKESYSCWLRGEFQRLTPKNIKQYKIEVVGNIYDDKELLLL